MYNIVLFQEFFEKHDSDKDGQIDFKEFVKYVTEQEKKLRLFFGKLDTNKDGKITKICVGKFLLCNPVS